MPRVVFWPLVAGGVLLALKVFVWFLEPKLLFFPFKGVQDTPATLGLSFRDLTIETRDGERLSAWWIDPPDARTDVVFFHGNGGNLSNWLPILAGIAAHGCAVLAIDYRGYGASTGSPSEAGLYRDADATLEMFWRALHRPPALSAVEGPRRVVYWGRSLGTVFAAYAAQSRPPDGIVLESPLPDKAAVIADEPIFRVLNLFSSVRLPTVEFLRRYSGPTLIIHGDADTTLPLPLGRAVFDAAPGPKDMLVIPGADHNDLHEVDPQRYWTGIAAFLRSVGARQ